MELDHDAPPPPALASAIAAREADLRKLRSDTGTLRRDLLGQSESDSDEVRRPAAAFAGPMQPRARVLPP